MQITFFSFIMAVIWSNLLIGLTYCIRKTQVFIRCFGISWMVSFYLLCVIRMLLPLEFYYTKVLALDGVFAEILIFTKKEVFTTKMLTINFMQLLLIIWIFVTVILLMRLIYQYYKFVKEASRYTKKDRLKYHKILHHIQQETNTNRTPSVLCSSDIKIPMGFGMIRKYILLPEGEFDEQELYYILLHEYTHFKNHDLFIKLLVHIFCCVFWWNPLAYLLQKDLSQVLEMKCDYVVCSGLKKEEKVSYLQAIVCILKNADQENMKFKVTAALAKTDNSLEMKERFQYILEQHGEKQYITICLILLIISVITLFLLSYSFVFQPKYEAPVNEIENTTSAFAVDDNDLYIVKKLDGSFELKTINGEYSVIIDEKFAELYIKQGVAVKEE